MESLKKLWNYNNWANVRLFKAFDHFGPAVPSSSVRLLSHIVNTQVSWLMRLRGEHSQIEAWAVHETEVCRQMHTDSAAGYQKMLDHLSDGPGPLIHYSNSSGQSYHHTAQDIILHVMNHGTYHRGQIAMDMRSKNLEPVNTDYITFLR